MSQDGKFTMVSQNGGALVYYLQRRINDTEVLHGFPEGFRMAAGDPTLRSYTSSPEQDAISFACINYAGGAPPEQPSIPNVNCPNGLRAQVFFPSCWNGDLDS